MSSTPGPVERFRAHVLSLWPRPYAWALPAPFVLWPLFRLLRGEARPEYFVFFFLLPTLAYTNEKTKKLFLGLMPLSLLGLIYDAMGFVKNVGLTPERVHDCDLHAFEASIFGVTLPDGTRGTVHDWIQAHPPVPWLDLLCSIPYGTFIFASFAFVYFLYGRDYPAMQRYGWTFLCLNLMGFFTYHLFPAAPPWYFHAHGCVIDLSTHANEGVNLMRVDKMIGVAYFHAFYGRSNDIFGAMPSLHVAYPLLIFLFGYRHFGVVLRVVTGAYVALMCVGAVYLDHHWILDVIVGVAYTVSAYVVGKRVFARYFPESGPPAEAVPGTPAPTPETTTS